ncbi:DUF7010 family protein [Thermaerobacillus caldiproteolyticus]|uniref:Uncharacterized protein n=1 Tax=Thermaerobacillus caldiproteolyticus TaxID=247480 RepID=A0A7V9Z7N7_9BACL|nr:hypothetical protein [Anoxybacillus caldiproteolyticus]MBA2875577.1 hypothetical protein [Anoxybacillus caldiproteolyticus]
MKRLLEKGGETVLNLLEVRNELSVRGKNGISFLLAATIIWAIITVIFLQPFGIKEKNVFMLYSTGLMFPLAIIISKMIKADWKANDNPLSKLGLYLNLAQIMYFPIIFWAFVKSPNNMVLFFAVITGAHFFPYGWLYNTKVYFIIAPIISILIMIIGWAVAVENLWLLPFTMVISLLFLNLLLYVDYKKKCK